ncbi:MAG: phenylalanine--tRNA ligase subunit beta, partial [Chloroflexi bacterium]|nr:phenylalanine--tRNA ligase subunit beta [Chloroflexota bacterium]
LDGAKRALTPANVLVCDEKGPLSIAGVMGGAESEVADKTRNILLEGAAWNFINIRRTAKQHNLPSEASFRFSRGVHPALAEQGVKRGLQLMSQWADCDIAPGLVDEYPLKPKDPTITVTPKDVKRLLGIELSAQEIVDLLERLEFKCKIKEPKLDTRKSEKTRKPKSESRISNTELSNLETRISVTAPPHRLDIGEGVIGLADVLEEVARVYGYDRIPETRMADALPPQIGNPVNEWEEHLRDLLVALGLQEVVTYRMTSVERESRVIAHNEYVRIANPIAPEKSILRRSLAASVLDALEKNIHLSESLSFFEIGPVFEPLKNDLPNEPRRLAVAMTGLRDAAAWDMKDSPALDFYDMKGRIELLLSGLGFTDISFASTDSVNYLHPGKAAQVQVNGQAVGAFGELHPLVREKYELGDAPVLVAEFDLEILRGIAPTYQAADKTMTDAEAAAIRNKIVKRLEQEVGAKLRS